MTPEHPILAGFSGKQRQARQSECKIFSGDSPGGRWEQTQELAGSLRLPSPLDTWVRRGARKTLRL